MKKFKNLLFKNFSPWMIRNEVKDIEFNIGEDYVCFEDLCVNGKRYEEYYDESINNLLDKLTDVRDAFKQCDIIEEKHLDFILEILPIYQIKSEENPYSSFFDEFCSEDLYKKYRNNIKKLPWNYINHCHIIINMSGDVEMTDHKGREIK